MKRRNWSHHYKFYVYKKYIVKALNKDDAVRTLVRMYKLKLRPTCSYNYKELQVLDDNKE